MKRTNFCSMILLLTIIMFPIPLSMIISTKAFTAYPNQSKNFLIPILSRQLDINLNKLLQKSTDNSSPLQSLNMNSMDNIGISANVTLKDNAFDGYNLFILQQLNKTSKNGLNRFLLITDLNGSIIMNKSLPLSNGLTSLSTEFINSTTLLFGYSYGIKLWNIYTNKTIYYNFNGHHEIEYNPSDKSFFVLSKKTVVKNNVSYLFDTIIEYNTQGKKVWSLATDLFISPSQWGPFKEMYRDKVDITHGNSIFFDVEADIIYLNCRNLDTFYKIDHKTGEVIWGLGRNGNFTLYDKKGVQRNSLFYHAHAVEKVDENTFILFDNDIYNITNPQNERSRLVEITINETTMTANESWSWKSPQEYFSNVLGDADRLPNENRLGTFGTKTHPNTDIGARLVEVNVEGEIVWEMNFPQTDNFMYTIYRMERVRFSPIISNPPDQIILPTDNVAVTWQTWYNFRAKKRMTGAYSLYLDGTEITNGPHTFDKFWRPTNMSFNLGTLELGVYNLTLALADEAGHITTSRVNISVVPFYVHRKGSQTIEIGQKQASIQWKGGSISNLLGNITVNDILAVSFVWEASSIINLDLNTFKAGVSHIRFSLFNNSKLIYNDTLWVMINPSNPPIFNSNPNDLSLTWNDSYLLSWDIFDYSPSSWRISINGTLAVSSVWEIQNYSLNWNLPVLDEGVYNVTLEIFDSIGHKNSSMIWLTIIPPISPIINQIPQQNNYRWGEKDIRLIWEVHGGNTWILWKNSSELRNGMVYDNHIEIQIDNWQSDNWQLGTYNLTLIVTKNASDSTKNTIWIHIWVDFGDPYANLVVHGSSLWYTNGDSAIGAPDGQSALIFVDYGNGYLTVDMGAGEEIMDEKGMDFTVVSQGGNYTTWIGNDLSHPFTMIGTGSRNTSFDLAQLEFSSARYVRVEYRSGATIELEAIVAINYNSPKEDLEAPLIFGPKDFWIWENQSIISLTWVTSDITPWNYSILISGDVLEAGPWDGSDISYSFAWSTVGEIQITLILYDLFENSNEFTVKINILPIQSYSKSSTIDRVSFSISILSILFVIFIFKDIKKKQRD